MDATITGLSTDQAYYLVDSIDPDAARVSGVDENEVTISPEGLEELGRFDQHADGHFDGRRVWIGGTDYAVRGI